MEADMIDQPPSTEVQILGSSVVPLYVERKMKVFAITESEFASVSTLNAQTTVFSSLGFAILSAALSIWINGIFYTEVPPTAFVAQRFIAPFGVLLAIAFFWLAWRSSKTRETTWTRIKEESASLTKREPSV
jgi:protein-S-isoprenylcysteine O-methyltransferase Ste14